jgi:hypothetical protein
MNVLYGPGDTLGVVTATSQAIDARNAGFFEEMHDKGIHFTVEAPMRRLVRELSLQLPPYDTVPQAGSQLLRDSVAVDSESPQAITRDWPRFADFEQSERGYNEYQNAWIGRRRRTALVSQIPMAAIEEHRQSIALAREQGWQDDE